MNKNKPTWKKPELVKIGTLKDVAGGAVVGTDTSGKGNRFRAIS